jgi:thioredoxin-like negative regulator of GroEL
MGENLPQLVLQNARRGLVRVDFRSPAVGPSLHQRDILSGLAQECSGRYLLAH